MVGVPVQSPSSSVSVSPSRGVPERSGATVLAGPLPSMTAVGALRAVSSPAAGVQVTETRVV